VDAEARADDPAQTGSSPEADRRRDDFGVRAVGALLVLAAVSVVLGVVDPSGAGLGDAMDVASIAAGGMFWGLLLWLAYGRRGLGRT
jgi:hypothetical protein